MSSGRSHTIIGALGGVCISKLALSGQPPQFVLAAVVCCALCASLPDLDLPHSIVTRVTRMLSPVLGLIVAISVAITLDASEATISVEELKLLKSWILSGLIVGTFIGVFMVPLIGKFSGGHRGLTHSIFTPVFFSTLALSLYKSGHTYWAVASAIPALGWALHIVGDIPTPAGWSPLRPLSNFPKLKFPYFVARHGEFLAVSGSIVATLWVMFCL